MLKILSDHSVITLEMFCGKSFQDILAGIFGDTLLTKRDALGRLDAVKGNKRKKRKIDFDRHPSRKWELPIDTTTISK